MVAQLSTISHGGEQKGKVQGNLINAPFSFRMVRTRIVGRVLWNGQGSLFIPQNNSLWFVCSGQPTRLFSLQLNLIFN